MQSGRFDGADAAACVGDNADIFWQANVGFADSPFDVRREIRLAVASEIDVHLSRTHIQLEARDINVLEAEIAMAGAHVDLDLERNIVGEM